MAQRCTFVSFIRFMVDTALLTVPGFVAFSTIGYGDFAPATPAGRSIFVVWAILGVGAMTILVSGK